ncbi:MAG: ComEA family DNA-binding protein [Gemmatimonadota bacterium]
MWDFNRVERRALVLGALLVAAGAGVRVGLGPRPGTYSWHPAPGDRSATLTGERAVRGAVAAAIAREETASRPLAEGEAVNPNSAAEEELRRLSGVGPALARAIVEERGNGRYRRLEDLLRVPGIGPVTLGRLAPHLSLAGRAASTEPVPAGRLGEGRAGLTSLPEAPARRRIHAGSNPGGGPVAARLDLNRADTLQLQALPGIGPARARAIVRTRRRLGRFDSVEELTAVPGIGPRTLARLRHFVFVR